MATYDKRVKISFNRLLDRTALRENWLEFFDGKLAETVSAMFQGQSGTLDAQKITLASTVADTFDLDMTNARRVVVGSGNVITLPTNASRVLKEHLQVPFENTSGQTYEVGIRYQQVEDDVQINGRTGAPEYATLREDMGEKGNPDSVTNNPGVSITLRVNGLTQSSIDHSGRKAIVFLTTPQSGVESVAFYEGTIAWNSPNNEIVIPYSGGNGPLGQDTSVNPPSTLTTDYVVFLPGASWKRGAATIYGDSDYAFIGRITGNGPSAIPATFNHDLQDPVFLITLQNAYDGIGSGGGRKIEVQDGAVRFHVPAAGAGDLNETAFEIDMLDNAQDGEIGQSIFAGGVGVGARKQAGFSHFMPLTHTTILQKDEPCSFSGGGVIMVCTRGGVHLQNANLIGGYEFALVSGTTSFNGIYRVIGIPASNMASLQYLDGSSPTFLGPETGTVTFLRPLLFSGDQSFWSRFHNVHMHGSNEETALAVVTIYPHQNAQSLAIKNQATASAVLFDKLGQQINYFGLKLQSPSVASAPNGDARANPLTMDMTNRDFRPIGEEWSIQAKNAYGQIVRELCPLGRWRHGNNWREDFQCCSFDSIANMPQHRIWGYADGSGTIRTALAYLDMIDGSSALLSNDQGLSGNVCQFVLGTLNDAKYRNLGFYTRCKGTGTSTVSWDYYRMEFAEMLGPGNKGFGFTHTFNDASGHWQFFDRDGLSWPIDYTFTDSGIECLENTWYELLCVKISNTQVAFWVTGMSAPAIHTMTEFNFGGLSDTDYLFRYQHKLKAYATDTSEWQMSYVDLVDIFDNHLR